MISPHLPSSVGGSNIFEVTVRTRLECTSTRDTEEAGLVVRTTEGFHYEIGVTQRARQRCVLVRRCVGSMLLESDHEILPLGPVERVLKAERNWYTFGYCPAETGSVRWLAKGETKFLSAEVTGSFLGVYIGLYATGKGERCTEPAFFDRFSYVPDDE